MKFEGWRISLAMFTLNEDIDMNISNSNIYYSQINLKISFSTMPPDLFHHDVMYTNDDNISNDVVLVQSINDVLKFSFSVIKKSGSRIRNAQKKTN